MRPNNESDDTSDLKVGHQNGMVAMAFPKPMHGILLPPESAIQVGARLIMAASDLQPGKWSHHEQEKIMEQVGGRANLLIGCDEVGQVIMITTMGVSAFPTKKAREIAADLIRQADWCDSGMRAPGNSP